MSLKKTIDKTRREIPPEQKQKFIDRARKGGLAAAKLGKAHMSRLGSTGGMTTFLRHGSEHYRNIAKGFHGKAEDKQ